MATIRGQPLVTTRRPHFPTFQTREDVLHMVAFGLNVDQIALLQHATVAEIKNHYAAELQDGLERINARVQASVLNQALNHQNVSAMKLWLVNKAGWRSGDGPKQLGKQEDSAPGTEIVPVAQRSALIEKFLSVMNQRIRDQEDLVDVTPAKPLK